MEYVDYRRYADYLRPAGSDVIDGARGRSRRGLHQAQAQEEEKEAAVAVAAAASAAAAPTGPKRLPVWWLFFLPLYWFPQGINFGLIQTYLLCVSQPRTARCTVRAVCLSLSDHFPHARSPFQIEDICGDARKQFFLSLMVTSENFGSFFGPIWGALSDAAVGSDGRRRRRPIIVFGQCLFVGACVLMATADSFYVLLLSYMLFTFTATLSGAPYTVTNTVVPLEQRGLYNALWSYQSLVQGFITSSLCACSSQRSASPVVSSVGVVGGDDTNTRLPRCSGAAVGEKWLSQSGAYAISYVVALFPTLPIVRSAKLSRGWSWLPACLCLHDRLVSSSLPLPFRAALHCVLQGLVGLGEGPPTRSRWWLPEPMAPKKSAKEQQQQEQEQEAPPPCTTRVALTVQDFVSAFQYPPFRWLFITNMCNAVCKCSSTPHARG
jgi:MFS family permease